MRTSSVEAIREYWQARPLSTQYVTDSDLEPGTPEFPELMPRIEAEAALLRGGHLLEIWCGSARD